MRGSRFKAPGLRQKVRLLVRAAVPVLILAAGCFHLGGTVLLAQDEEVAIRSMFLRANQLYKENAFDDAIAEYNKILSRGQESAAIYYNLGNCYAKKGASGYALLYFEKARMRAPGDSDIKANSDFIRESLGLPQPALYGNVFARFIDRATGSLGLNMLTAVLFVVYICIIGCLILRLFVPVVRRFDGALGAALIIVMAGCGFALQRKIVYLRAGAVVIVKESQVSFEPLENATVYFTLGQGSLVEVLQKQDGWVKLRRADGRIGWTQASAIATIS